MKIQLDNAQSGGPVIKIIRKGEVVFKLYPRAENKEMIYWGDKDNMKSLNEMSEEDGIVLYERGKNES